MKKSITHHHHQHQHHQFVMSYLIFSYYILFPFGVHHHEEVMVQNTSLILVDDKLVGAREMGSSCIIPLSLYDFSNICTTADAVINSPPQNVVDFKSLISHPLTEEDWVGFHKLYSPPKYVSYFNKSFSAAAYFWLASAAFFMIIAVVLCVVGNEREHEFRGSSRHQLATYSLKLALWHRETMMGKPDEENPSSSEDDNDDDDELECGNLICRELTDSCPSSPEKESSPPSPKQAGSIQRAPYPETQKKKKEKQGRDENSKMVRCFPWVRKK